MSKKITDLPASAGLTLTDIFEVTDDPAGAAASQKATFTQLRAVVMPIVNADVDAAAAIAASKVVQATGTGMVTVTAGALTAASTALGTGVATWFTTPSSANLLAALSDKTGTGLNVFDTAPLFKTTLNINNPANTFKYVVTPGAIAADRVLNIPILTGPDTLAVLDLAQTFTNKTIAGASNTLSVRIANDVTGLAANVATFLGTSTSANLLAALTDETGTGACVFGTAPTMTACVIDYVTLGGGTPATAGAIRLPYAAGAVTAMAIMHSGGAANVNIIKTTGNALDLGDAAAGSVSTATLSGYTLDLVSNASGDTVALHTVGNFGLYVKSATIQSAKPIIGYGSSSSPYNVHGVVISAMTDAAYAVPAGEYAYSLIEVPATLTLTATRAFKLPTPATEAASYNIEVSNLTTGAQTLTISRADGAGVTYPLLTTVRARFKVRPGGVYLDATTIT